MAQSVTDSDTVDICMSDDVSPAHRSFSMTRVVTETRRHADILSYGYAVRFIAMLAVVISHMWVLSLHAQGSMVTVQLYQLPTQYPGPGGASMLARPS